MNPRLLIVALVPAVLVGVIVFALTRRMAAPAAPPAPAAKLVSYQRHLPRVMGTVATLTVVAGEDQKELAEQTLSEMEAILRAIEDKMSTYIPGTELSRLNGVPVGEFVGLTPETVLVLRQAKEFTPQTRGAFDVTCRPILEMWKAAGKRKSAPTTQEREQAVADTGWRGFELTDKGASRKNAGASIDLGGIAKKYGIDRAFEAMVRRGVKGGFIDVGGDIRCFGQRVGGGPWRVGVRNPFSNSREDLMAIVTVPEGSVCTSGNYERFAEIDGRRYSHIVDPRTGETCDNAPSVTVVGPDAHSAGLWATALSVLGIEGLKLIPPQPHLEVMMVVGRNPEDSRWYRTPGFDQLLTDKPAQPPTELPAGLWPSTSPTTRPTP